MREELPESPRFTLPVMGAGGKLTAVGLVVFGFVLSLAFDVAFLDALRWFASEALYVVLPGWLAFAAFASRPGGALRQLTMGWALGYVLEILAFMATAALDIRFLMFFYPILAAIPLGLLLRRRRRRPERSDEGEEPLPDGAIFAIGGMVALSVIAFALPFFAASPLPGGGVTVSYFQDFPWTISLAADALHHWPMTDSSVSGEPLPYHNFSILHLASMSQVSGVELPVGFFRLWILPLTALITLQMVEAGRSLFGSWRAGLIAAFLLFFVGEFQLFVDAFTDFPFGWLVPTHMFTSPSFLFGVPILFALVTLVGESPASRQPRIPKGDLVIIGVLGVGAAGAKVSILPLLLPALAILFLVRLVRSREIDWRLVAIGLLLILVQVFFYWTLYRGHSSGLGFDLDGAIHSLRWEALIEIRQHLDFLPTWLRDSVLLVIELFGMLAPLLAGTWLLLRDRAERSKFTVQWLAAILSVGFLTLFFMSSGKTGNYLYGANYGFMVGVLLAAGGLTFGWASRPEGWERRRPVRWLAGGWLLTLALLLAAQQFSDASGSVFGIEVLLAAFVVFAVLARLVLGRSGDVALLLCLALLATGFLGGQLSRHWGEVFDPPEVDLTNYRITPGIYEGLRWMRDETPEDAVFAINRQYAHSGGPWPNAYDYAAFSERRAFFGAWAYSQRVRDSGLGPPFAEETLFPERKELNDAAYAGDPAAMKTLRERYGVGYMVIDRVNGDPYDLPRIRKHSTVVFEDPDLVIVELER